MEGQQEAQVKEMPDQPAAAASERSTIDFPYTDLDNAVEVAKGVRDVGGTTCTSEQLAAGLGVEAKGGGFRLRLNAATTYDVIAYERGGRITLTDLGRRIVDPQEERAARRDAFLKVPLYAKVFEEFKGRPLPPQAALERAMVGFGVGRKVADKARQVMMRSARQGGFFELSPDRLTEPPIRGIATPDQQSSRRDVADTSGNGGGSGGGQHPLIQGLLLELPAPKTAWSTEQRMNWLGMANSIFKMLYTAQDSAEIEIKLKEKKAEDLV